MGVAELHTHTFHRIHHGIAFFHHNRRMYGTAFSKNNVLIVVLPLKFHPHFEYSVIHSAIRALDTVELFRQCNILIAV